MDIVVSEKQFKNTKNLLNLISKHLSSREDCNNCNYYVTIYEDLKFPWDVHIVLVVGSSKIKRRIYVFPDKYHRKQTDKLALLNHLFESHLGEMGEISTFLLHDDKYVCAYKDEFIPGVYVFKQPKGSKKRHWERIR